MSNNMKLTIEVQGIAIAIVSKKREKFSNIQVSFPIIQICENLRNLWMKFQRTIRRFHKLTQIFAIWGQFNNQYSNSVEFDGIRMQTGLNSFAHDGYELKALDGFLKGWGI